MRSPRSSLKMTRMTQPADEDEIYSVLLACADLIRDRFQVSASLRYVSALLLLKWCSDNFTNYKSGDGLFRDWILPRAAQWEHVRSAGYTDSAISAAISVLQQNNSFFSGLSGGLGFGRNAQDLTWGTPDRSVRAAADRLNQLHLSVAELDPPSAAGVALERLIAAVAGTWRSGMESIATPSDLAGLITQISDASPGMAVGDPACGAGSLLIRSADYVAQKTDATPGIDPVDIALHGQDISRDTAAISQITLLLHGFLQAKVTTGDSLTSPILDSDGGLTQFDRVVSHPPISTSWRPEAVERDPFGRFYLIPPRNVADYAFVQHILATLRPHGRGVVVVSPGALFRGGVEAQIRSHLMELDVIDAVIALPPGLLYGTSIPVALLVLSKDRPPDRSGRVLIVNGSRERVPTSVRRRLAPESFTRIVTTFREYTSDGSFSRAVTSDELRRVDFDLRPVHHLAQQPARVRAPHDVLDETRIVEAERDEIAAQMDELIATLLPPREQR